MRHHHREISEKKIQSHIFFRSFYLTIWGKAAFNVVKSIPYLLKYPEVPLIFTEYYEEDSKYNLEKVDSLGKEYSEY